MNKESWFDLQQREDTLIFRFCKAPTPAVGPTTHHPFQWVPLASSLAVKWASLEAEHSDVFNADVKNVWSRIFTFAICLYNLHRNNMTVHFQDSAWITVTSEVYHDGGLKVSVKVVCISLLLEIARMAKEKLHFVKCLHEDSIPGLLRGYKLHGQHV